MPFEMTSALWGVHPIGFGLCGLLTGVLIKIRQGFKPAGGQEPQTTQTNGSSTCGEYRETPGERFGLDGCGGQESVENVFGNENTGQKPDSEKYFDIIFRQVPECKLL